MSGKKHNTRENSKRVSDELFTEADDIYSNDGDEYGTLGTVRGESKNEGEVGSVPAKGQGEAHKTGERANDAKNKDKALKRGTRDVKSRTDSLFPKNKDIQRVKKGSKKRMFTDALGRIYTPISKSNDVYRLKSDGFSDDDSSFIMMNVALRRYRQSKSSPFARYEEGGDVAMPEPLDSLELFKYDGSTDKGPLYGVFQVDEVIANRTTSGYVIMTRI